ncbi:hypothetical protein ABH923_002750 [Leifsonia sp. EB41]|uniref:RES domain-containing protein n=1 Tax=Leifsonia sp. EB41 TaxID=3156260 RepID=UPI0035115570
MFVYRVIAYDPAAKAGNSGSPTYVYPRQTSGRWDNFPEYMTIYVSSSAEAAIGETFGRHPEWGDSMLDVRFTPGARYALARYSMNDDTPIVTLDDAATLLSRGMRPTQVVIRNVPYTQSVALNIFRERAASGERRWAGISWWSFWKPIWPVTAVWFEKHEDFPLALVDVEPLHLAHPAMLEAAKSLVRVIV